MRIALLGVDDDMLVVAAAAVHAGADEIVMIDATAPRAKEAAAMAPKARLVADPDAMLDDQSVDAVLVAVDQPAVRIEQLRRLIQVAMPVLVSHPVSLSMLDCYELEMIREETKSIVLAYLPARWHPAAIELGEMVDGTEASSIGAVEQVVLERFIEKRERDVVLRQFARDADLLQFIAGDATKLHALGSARGAAGADPYANLAVQITCDDGLVCRWTVSPVESEPGGRITLVGSRGKAILWMPQSNWPWQLETRIGSSANSNEYPEWDPAAAALETLSLAREHTETDSNWSEASRTVELAETIDRSLAKGRTIDLHNEEFSDIGTFKGTMASVGCGLLLIGMVMVVIVAIVHALAVQAGWNRLAAVLDCWPYLLLVVCGIYLLLQLLVFVGKPRQPPDQGQISPPDDG